MATVNALDALRQTDQFGQLLTMDVMVARQNVFNYR